MKLHHRARLFFVLPTIVVLILVDLLWWAPWHHQAVKPRAVTPPAVAVIEITNAGFVPSTLTVNPNTDVVWVNEDIAPHLPAADPYPSHSSLPSLVPSRALGQHESYTYRVSRPETIHYHDDLQPTQTGTVIVR